MTTTIGAYIASAYPKLHDKISSQVSKLEFAGEEEKKFTDLFFETFYTKIQSNLGIDYCSAYAGVFAEKSVRGLERDEACNWASVFAEGYITGLTLDSEKAEDFARYFVSEIVDKEHTREFAFSYAKKKIEAQPEEYCIIFAHLKENEGLSDSEAEKKAKIGLKLYEERRKKLQENKVGLVNFEDVALVFVMQLFCSQSFKYAESFSSCFGFLSLQNKSTQYKAIYAEAYTIAKQKGKAESYSRVFARVYAEHKNLMQEDVVYRLADQIASDWTKNRNTALNRQPSENPQLLCACEQVR